METTYMNRLFLMLAATIIISLTPAQGKEVPQLNENIKRKPTFLTLLYSDYESCLGTLIHKQWILTAAHCFLPFLEIETVSPQEESFKKLSLKSFLYVQHPNFTRDSAEHNLMLIKVRDPIELKDQVMLVDLPNTTDDRLEEQCTVSGWGWTCHATNTDYPDIQVNHEFHWFSKEHRQEPNIREIPIRFTENMFCAGSSLNTLQSCKEVTAAPILCQNQLHAILSWSPGCILRGDIGYYTKISRYTDWILNVISTY